MKVLHVAPAYYPAIAWGGPTESVYRLCNAIGSLQNVELRVLTTDTAGRRTSERLSKAQKAGTAYPNYAITFCRKLAGSDFTPSVWLRVWSLVKWADVVHLTSVYSSTTFPTLAAARLLRKPVVWSPRGSLQRWAKSRRRLAKYLWDSTCDLLLDRERSVLHATSQSEADESVRRIRNARPVVIPNGVDAVAGSSRSWLPESCLRLLYLGRLDPKKGIENLLDALALLQDRRFSLRICGAGDPQYVRSLAFRVDRLGLGNRVHFVGHVSGEAKRGAFIEADVCVVPSHMENFCLVVAEALAHGTPVIASTGTPWAELEERRAGLWISNDPVTLAAAIEEFRSRDLAAMGTAGRRWMETSFDWQTLALQMHQVYESLCEPSHSRRAAISSQ